MEKLPVTHTPVREGDQIAWGPLAWQVIDVPGHTAGHEPRPGVAHEGGVILNVITGVPHAD